MKMFSDCSGECCICAHGDFCIAGHGDDYFQEAGIEKIIERLNKGQYPWHKDYMESYLKNKYSYSYSNDDKRGLD